MEHLPIILASVALFFALLALSGVIWVCRSVYTCAIMLKAANVQLARIIETTGKVEHTFSKVHDIVVKKASDTTRTKRPDFSRPVSDGMSPPS